MNPKETALHLYHNTQLPPSSLEVEVSGIRITFPYLELARMSPWELFEVPQEIQDSFATLYNIFNEPLPPNWTCLLKKAQFLQKHKGIDHPLDLVTAVNFVLHNYLDKLPAMPITKFPSPNGYPLFLDQKETVFIINYVVRHPQLSQLLLEELVTLIPDACFHFDDRNGISFALSHLKRVGITKGRILDLGCGTGNKTRKIHAPGFRVIGLDRQYHSPWYQWEANESLSFARSDIRQLPLPNSCIQVAILDSVVSPDITIQALESIIGEIGRVLVPDTGLLLVGPQYDSYADWGLYQNTSSNCFQPVSY